eukprot:14626058-Ditylum_brightwellii.AAC.1
METTYSTSRRILAITHIGVLNGSQGLVAMPQNSRRLHYKGFPNVNIGRVFKHNKESPQRRKAGQGNSQQKQ